MKRNVVLMVLVASAAWAQGGRDLSKVEVKATKVSGNVYVLEGAGGNIGVSAGEDGILLIDDQFAPLAPKIEKAIKPLSKKPVRFVLNTHFHGDHTGGNEVFGKSAPVIAHENVRVRLAGKNKDWPAHALPVLTWRDGISLHLNGEEIRVKHVGTGHTDGDSIVIFPKSKVMHTGDLFFNGVFPVIDLDNGGGVKALVPTLKKLRALIEPEMKLIPGHGPVGAIKDLDAYIAMLEETSARVQKGVAAGKSKEALKQEKVFAGYESWGTDSARVDRYLDALYREHGGK